MKQEQEDATEEITEVAPGILRLQLPIDFTGLGHVNCYALEDERLALLKEADALKQQRNQASEEVAKLKKAGGDASSRRCSSRASRGMRATGCTATWGRRRSS